MTSVKAKFRESTMPSVEGFVYYQITHDRKVRHLSTGYRIRHDEWDERRSMVIPGRDVNRHDYVVAVHAGIIRDLQRFARIVNQLSSTRLVYSVDDVIDEFVSQTTRHTLGKFMRDLIQQFRRIGRIRTAETYSSALNSFCRFLAQSDRHVTNCDDIMLDCLDSVIIEGYQAWLSRRGILPNTISFYNRILRAVYNRAVDHKIIENRRPFLHVYTGVDKTMKRALPLDIIRKIKRADLACMPGVDYARDMFMLSFYLRGMSFVDMAFLQKSDMRHGYITYRRRKTGQLLTIAWTNEMQQIIDKYPPNSSRYLLPIIRSDIDNERRVYHNVGYNINRNLKKLAVLVDAPQSLTLYCARHSWASVAWSKGVPISVISEGMGHDSESTTRIYLASLDTAIVDKANSLIMASL